MTDQNGTTRQKDFMDVVMSQLEGMRDDIKDVASDVIEVKLALAKREQDAVEVTRLRDKVDTLTSEVAALKIKSGVWGVAGGLLASVGAVLFILLKG